MFRVGLSPDIPRAQDGTLGFDFGLELLETEPDVEWTVLPDGPGGELSAGQLQGTPREAVRAAADRARPVPRAVILTPHSIGHTDEFFRLAGRIACENVLAVRDGREPSFVVNTEVLRPGAPAAEAGR